MGYEIPLWLAILLLIAGLALAAFLFEPRLRGYTHSNPKPKTRPPLRSGVGQAPMSPLIRRNLKAVATAVRKKQKTVILDGNLYTLKEIGLDGESDST